LLPPSYTAFRFYGQQAEGIQDDLTSEAVLARHCELARYFGAQQLELFQRHRMPSASAA
jgi:hypothetical protein